MGENWKYITPEVIAAKDYYPPNAEAAQEAERYNALITESLKKNAAWLKTVDLYKVLNITILSAELFMLFRNPITEMISIFLFAIGLLLFCMRYVTTSMLSFRWKNLSIGESFEAVTAPTNEPEWRKIFIISVFANLAAIVLLMDSFLPDVRISIAAAAVHLIALICYVLPAKKYNTAVSVMISLLPLLVRLSTVVYTGLMIWAAVIENKRRKALEAAFGYPELSPINVRYYRPGAAALKARENPGGTKNSGMESI